MNNMLKMKVKQAISQQMILRIGSKLRVIPFAVMFALIASFKVNALENPNLLSANMVENARGEQIILLDEEELVREPQNTLPTQRKIVTPYQNSDSKFNKNYLRQQKTSPNKKQSTNKKGLLSKLATGESAVISKIEFKQANILDVARALADVSGLNVVATEDASKKM